jgi:hypothetical protein
MIPELAPEIMFIAALDFSGDPKVILAKFDRIGS